MSLAEGAVVELRRLRVSDLKAIARFPFALSAYEPMSKLERAREVYDQTGFWTPDAGVAAIQAGDRLVGSIQYYRAGTSIHGLELAYQLLDPEDIGKGYATEALRLLGDLLFAQHPNVRRLQLLVPRWDDTSARRVEDAGYASEGLLRKAGFNADGPEDCLLYSKVRD